MSKLSELKNEAVEVFKDYLFNDLDMQERLDYVQSDDPHDQFCEIADGQVPVYTADSLEMAAEDTSLATEESDLCPEGTPLQIINANIYETIQAELWDYWRREKDEIEEDAQEIVDAMEELEEALEDEEDERLGIQIVEDIAKERDPDADTEILEILQGHLQDIVEKQGKKPSENKTS